jgi:adenylosuccinate lyase
LTDLIAYDKRIMQFIKTEELEKLFNPKAHIGLAPKKCRKMVKDIQQILQ